MAIVSTSSKLMYSPIEMYELVNDVNSYPNYIPMCSGVKLISRTSEKLKASLTMSKGKIKLNFTTENTMQIGRSIQMRLVEGPFKRLNGLWLFEPMGETGCTVTFRLEFEFANALLNVAFGGFFREVGGSMVDAFSRQAALKYGAR